MKLMCFLQLFFAIKPSKLYRSIRAKVISFVFESREWSRIHRHIRIEQSRTDTSVEGAWISLDKSIT